MTKAIQREILIPQPPEQVWRAIADSTALAEWMFPNDFQPRVGHQFTFRVPPNPKVNFDGLIVRCEVLECQPPSETATGRLEFSWSAGGPVENTRVSFRLEPDSEGTRLLFEHSGFDVSQPFGEQALKGAEFGWARMFKQLAAVVAQRLHVVSQEAKPEYVVPAAGKRGMTPLHHAAYLNDPDAVRAELKRGTPVDVRDDGGWTPLHWSIDMAQAQFGEPEQVVWLLLEAGASPNSVDNSGFSVLMMACGRNNEAILERLILAGANVNLRTAETTPLHEAAGCNFSEGIQRLLALGANPHQTDSRGRTPEQVAEECGFDECVAVLRSAPPVT